MAVKIVDLTNPWGADTPMWPFAAPKPDLHFERVMYHEKGDPAVGGGTRAIIYHGTLHASTHMDAPSHRVELWEGGVHIDKVPLENCYGTGVVVDMRHLGKWDQITGEELEKAKPKIESGDFVVINTGWHKYWRQNNYVYFNHYPGLVADGAEWLIKKKVKAVAGTWGALDHPLAHIPLAEKMPWLYKEYVRETGKDPDKEFPIYEPCHYLLLKNGIVGYENAGGDVDEVTGKRVTLAGFGPRCELADGCFVRLVAIVEE